MKLKNERKRTLLIIFGLTIFILAACRFSLPISQQSATNNMRSQFDQKSETEVHTIEIKDGMTSMNLHGLIKLDSGSATWQVMDPRGDIVWQGEGEGGEVKINESIRLPKSGTWVLHVDLENAAGSYNLTWKAK